MNIYMYILSGKSFVSIVMLWLSMLGSCQAQEYNQRFLCAIFTKNLIKSSVINIPVMNVPMKFKISPKSCLVCLF